jgi:uncharacterized membrane protein
MTANGPRPFGVTLVGILIFISGVALIVVGILNLLDSEVRKQIGVWAVVVSLLIGIIYLLVASGIFNGNKGSRLVVAIITALSLIAGVLTMFTSGLFLHGLVQTLIAVIIFILLFGARARQYFG